MRQEQPSVAFPSRTWLLHGRAEPPPRPRVLRAGTLRAWLDGIDVRYLTLGRVELVRRVHVVVRDGRWRTVPAQTAAVRVTGDGERFAVEFEARHVLEELDLSWRGRISGDASGTLVYEMLGRAVSDFDHCRLGLCVLHPPAETAGRPFRMTTEHGRLDGVLPWEIGPIGLVDGVSRALFEPFSALEIDLPEGGAVRLGFEGELFEIEDQRNWADGNFKTYCPPIARGFPQRARAGETIEQRLTVDGRAALQQSAAARTPIGETVVLSLGAPLGTALPPVGLGLASHGAPLSVREAALLRRLDPAHLRADVRVTDPEAQALLARARADCAALGVPLELALFAGEQDGEALAAFAPALAGCPLVRVIALEADPRAGTPSETTTAALARLVRDRLGGALDGVAVVGGTDRFFCELNRTPPDVTAIDGVVFSTHATFHELDDLSLFETLEAQGDTVRSARALAGGRDVVVSPTTLAGRSAPFGPGRSLATGPLPPEVDARQLALLAAPWTIGSIKHTAEAGAAALTLFETTGWRGLLETEEGSALPEAFPSVPGQVFPVWFALLALAGLRGADLLDCPSSRPLTAVALALRAGERMRIVVANLTPFRQKARLDGLGSVGSLAQRSWLGAADLPDLLARPEAHDPVAHRVQADGGSLGLVLEPYGLLVLDAGPDAGTGDPLPDN